MGRNCLRNFENNSEIEFSDMKENESKMFCSVKTSSLFNDYFAMLCNNHATANLILCTHILQHLDKFNHVQMFYWTNFRDDYY